MSDLHQSYESTLIVPQSIDAKDMTKVLCDDCQMVPLLPVRCFKTNKIYCQGYFYDYVQNHNTSPAYRVQNGGLNLKEAQGSLEERNQLLQNCNLTPEQVQLFSRLQLKCPNHIVGCSVVSNHSEILDHYTQCLNVCTFCNQPYLMALQSLHQSQCQSYQEFIEGQQTQSREQAEQRLKTAQQIAEKEAKLKILQNEIKEQEMVLESKRNKLFKTKVVSLMLVIIAVLHVFNYHEIQKEQNESLRSYEAISELLNQPIFINLQRETSLQHKLIRFEEALKDLKKNLDPEDQSSLFDIDRFRDQLTLGDYYCEYFSQLYYLIFNIQHQSHSYTKQLGTKCAPQKRRSEMRQGVGKECLKKQLGNNPNAYQEATESIKRLKDILNRQDLSFNEHEKMELREFFNKVENAVEFLDKPRKAAVHQSIHLLREELGVM
eukprot:403371882